jgi:hypothetical protein
VIAGKSVTVKGSSKRFAFVHNYDDKPKRCMYEVLKSQGMQSNQQVTFLSDGGDTVRDLQMYLNPNAEHILDWCTPARVGLSHFPDKITNFTIGFWSSGTFGFEFPEKLKTLAVPAHNCIRLYYDKRFAPRTPNSGKQNPEEPIRPSNFRSLVCPFHYGQLVAKCKVLGSEIRSDIELRPYEQNKISKRFHHNYNLAGACKFVNNFRKYEYLRRTGQFVSVLGQQEVNGLAIFVDGSIQITPFTFDLDVGLIHSPAGSNSLLLFPEFNFLKGFFKET